MFLFRIEEDNLLNTVEVEEEGETISGENFVSSHVGENDTVIKEDNNEYVKEHIKESLENVYEDENEGDAKRLVKGV